MKTREEILRELEGMSNNYNDQKELQTLHNQATEHYNDYDNLIYDMEWFNDILEEMKPLEIINCMFYGDFNPNHDWAMFNGYGNFKSTMFIDDFIDYDTIIDYILDTEHEDFESEAE